MFDKVSESALDQVLSNIIKRYNVVTPYSTRILEYKLAIILKF